MEGMHHNYYTVHTFPNLLTSLPHCMVIVFNNLSEKWFVVSKKVLDYEC